MMFVAILHLPYYRWYIRRECGGDPGRRRLVHPALLRELQRRAPERPVQERVVPGQGIEMAPYGRHVTAGHGSRERRRRLLAAQVLERALDQGAQRLPRVRI